MNANRFKAPQMQTTTNESVPSDPAPASLPTAACDLSAADVQACLDGSGPVMRYQPIVHLETGVVIGAEAFSRFPSTAPTLEWFKCAEAAGLGPDLERRAVANVLDAQPDWPTSWRMICLNVSPDRLNDSKIHELLTQCKSSDLVVELTDQTALPVDLLLKQQLEELRCQGVRIAVSGLRPSGVGYDRVLRIQPEVVKLDVQLLDGIASDPIRRRFVEELVPRCHRDGMFVVAVGIETDEQLDYIRNVGIEAAQGHLFGSAADLGSPTLTSTIEPTALMPVSF